MYKKARLRLTLFYSLLFFTVFWCFSLGLFYWMQQSLGQGYITKIQEIHEKNPTDKFDTVDEKVVTVAGNVALQHLEEILLIFNGGLLIIIPLWGWYLTGKTLQPIKKSYEQQKQFVSDASHELKTPLSIISGEIEVALMRERTIAEYIRIIRSNKEEIDRLVKLVQNLLYLTKSDYAVQFIVFQEIDITDLLNSITAEYSFKIEKKKLKVHLEPATESQIVIGQESMIRTLFSNLLDNAIKYTPDKGNIWIKVRNSDDYTVVSIKDDGIGINPENQEKIFHRFYRVESSRSETKGFGLGLAIVKSILERHKGRISVESGQKKGSTFSVYLPK